MFLTFGGGGGYPAGMGVDWRDVFVRYVVVVIGEAGTDLLNEDDWSPEEWAAIQAAAGEINAACDRVP